MADAGTLVTVVAAALISDQFGFYDGQVPTSLPTIPGTNYVRPYVVLWAGDGEPADEATACGLQGTDVLQWDFQTTVVAATPAACRGVARDVRAALTNLPAGNGHIKPNPDGFQQAVPVPDNSVTPARYMLPIPWRLYTN